ncbi:MAG: hypothetical protein PWP04_697 [Candidatus Atribacteria bacterium]|nr:hypothetical protein [Candidatus Atribacteria bacterium]
MKRKGGICLTLAFLLLLVTSAFSQEQTVSPLVEDLEAMEKVLYGVPQTGSVLNRVEKMERDLIGDTLSGSLMERVNTLRTFILTGTAEEPSLAFKIKAVRLTLQSQPAASGILMAELEQLEELIFGQVSREPIGVRVDRLFKTCVDPAQAGHFTVQVPAGTLVKITIQTRLHSEKSREGDPVPFVVAEDVKVDDVLVIPAGTRGEGYLKKVKGKGNFGKPGRLEVEFGEVLAIDGTSVLLTLGEEAIRENKAVAYAVGASIAGLALLGPIGAVAGVFVQGDAAVVEAGSELFVEIDREIEVRGPLAVGRANSLPRETIRPEESPSAMSDSTLGFEEEWYEEEEEEWWYEEEVQREEVPQQEPADIPEVEVEIKPYEEWYDQGGVW